MSPNAPIFLPFSWRHDSGKWRRDLRAVLTISSSRSASGRRRCCGNSPALRTERAGPSRRLRALLRVGLAHRAARFRRTNFCAGLPLPRLMWKYMKIMALLEFQRHNLSAGGASSSVAWAERGCGNGDCSRLNAIGALSEAGSFPMKSPAGISNGLGDGKSRVA